jgi:hypothetical protein
MEISNRHRHGALGRTIEHRHAHSGSAEVIPFGRYGAGLWTASPIGLVIAVGLFVMVLAGMPEARPFFAAAAIVGALCGFVLWFRHR